MERPVQQECSLRRARATLRPFKSLNASAEACNAPTLARGFHICSPVAASDRQPGWHALPHTAYRPAPLAHTRAQVAGPHHARGNIELLLCPQLVQVLLVLVELRPQHLLEGDAACCAVCSVVDIDDGDGLRLELALVGGLASIAPAVRHAPPGPRHRSCVRLQCSGEGTEAQRHPAENWTRRGIILRCVHVVPVRFVWVLRVVVSGV